MATFRIQAKHAEFPPGATFSVDLFRAPIAAESFEAKSLVEVQEKTRAFIDRMPSDTPWVLWGPTLMPRSGRAPAGFNAWIERFVHTNNPAARSAA